MKSLTEIAKAAQGFESPVPTVPEAVHGALKAKEEVMQEVLTTQEVQLREFDYDAEGADSIKLVTGLLKKLQRAGEVRGHVDSKLEEGVVVEESQAAVTKAKQAARALGNHAFALCGLMAQGEASLANAVHKVSHAFRYKIEEGEVAKLSTDKMIARCTALTDGASDYAAFQEKATGLSAQLEDYAAKKQQAKALKAPLDLAIFDQRVKHAKAALAAWQAVVDLGQAIRRSEEKYKFANHQEVDLEADERDGLEVAKGYAQALNLSMLGALRQANLTHEHINGNQSSMGEREVEAQRKRLHGILSLQQQLVVVQKALGEDTSTLESDINSRVNFLFEKIAQNRL